MSTILALLLLTLLQGAGVGQPVAAAPEGHVDAGQRYWAAPASPLCRNCHGTQGEGGFGPDLAGRGLSFAQFRKAVRQPWGVMPAFTDMQVSDQNLADLAAYFTGLPKVAVPGSMRFSSPPGAPAGQVLIVETAGCAMCHQPELRDPRMVLGGEFGADLDFATFAKYVYDHTEIYPRGRMGNFSRARLPETVLREMFRFVKDDLGLLPNITAAIDAGKADGANTTYTLTVRNGGEQGKGIAGGDVTISLVLPAGATIISTTGAGYQGVSKNPDGASVAAWNVASVAPGDRQIYTLTLPGPAGVPNTVFRGSTVAAGKPAMRMGVPDLALKDARMPGKTFETPVVLPPVPRQPAPTRQQ